MNEMQAIILIVSVTLLISAAFHYRIKKYFDASVLSALTCTVVYQALSYLEAGYLDPFFIIGLVTGTLLALAISLVVGIPFFIWRRNKKTSSGPAS